MMKQHRIEISPLPQWREARGEGTKAQIINFLKIDIEKVTAISEQFDSKLIDIILKYVEMVED